MTPQDATGADAVDPRFSGLPGRPGKIVAVHLSYASRADQRGRRPAAPSYFLKPASSVAASGGTIERPAGTELLAFEGEIALIIGEPARRVSSDEAWSHVGWVTASNDFGLYDLRANDRGSNVRSKGGDGFTPIGPSLVDARLVDPAALRVRTWVNGVVVQDDTTEGLIFPLAQFVADLSQHFTLETGDVILTGTPAGSSVVGPGDVVEVEVDAPDAPGAPSSGRLVTTVTQGSVQFDESVGSLPAVDDTQRAEAWGSREAAGLTPESAPRDTESAPGDAESAPRDTESAPGDTESAPGDAESAPGDSESAPGANPDSLTRTRHALSSTPDALSRTPDALSRTPDALSRTPDALSRTPDTLSRTPGALSRAGLDQGLREKLLRAPVAGLSAQLRKRGLNNVSIDGVRPLHPESKLVGVARTLRFVPNREDLFASHGGGYNAQKQAFDAVREGEVIVIEARGEAGSGTLGDILAIRAHANRAAGIVTDGGVRDRDAVAAVGIPVYASGAHPAVLGRKHVPWDLDITVACGGTTVQPGDIIVGDSDGVIVIPPGLVEEVVDATLTQENEDAWIADQVAAGHPVDGLFPMNAQWRAKFDARAEKA